MSYRDFYPRTIRRTYDVAPHVLEMRDVAASSTLKGGYLEGWAVPFKTWADIGPYLERIWPSCFMESTAQDPHVPLLLFHNSQAFPVGRAEEWQHQDEGLYGRWRLDDFDDAERVRRQAVQGLLRFSIGFRSTIDGTDFQFEGDQTFVTRLQARLLEVSLTPTPAYSGAKVTKAGP